MTEHSVSHEEPSMEDILASIRQIMDDEDAKGPTSEVDVAAAAAQPVVSAAAEAAEAPQPDFRDEPDPEEETIFPERGGLLWRRVAGRALSEEEDDEDSPFDLTDEIGAASEDGEGIDSLLDAAAASETGSDEEALYAVSRSAETWQADGTAREGGEDEADEFFAAFNRPEPEPEAGAVHEPDAEPGIAAAAATGVAAAASALGGAVMMDRVIERASSTGDDEDDDVLDLTQTLGSDSPAIDRLADAMAGNSEPVDPEPVMRSAAVPPPLPPEAVETAAPADSVEETPATESGEDDDALLLDEALDLDDESDSYDSVLRPGSGYDGGALDDAHERALDARFYEDSASFEDEAPEIEGDYAASLGGDAETAAFLDDARRDVRDAGQGADDLDTVGGLVRDALKGRVQVEPDDDGTAPIVDREVEESSSRALATLTRYDTTPRRVYGQLRITDDVDSPTVEGIVRDELRPMLREWLNDNLPTVVEGMVKQEVERISARSRRFVRSDDD